MDFYTLKERFISEIENEEERKARRKIFILA